MFDLKEILIDALLWRNDRAEALKGGPSEHEHTEQADSYRSLLELLERDISGNPNAAASVVVGSWQQRAKVLESSTPSALEALKKLSDSSGLGVGR